MNIPRRDLPKQTLEITVWDHDEFKSNDFMGELIIHLKGNKNLLNVSATDQSRVNHVKVNSVAQKQIF